MRKIILLSWLLFSFLISFTQQQAPSTLVIKIPAVADSLRMSKERQSTLSASLNTANKERKNFLLFPAGTRKTKDQDALYIGRLEKKEVYKVNLASVVSKYAGETEKNLEHLFAEAVDKHWVLFFDEADALFSRSEQPDATANSIQKLAQAKNVLTIFWCEEDCLKWLKNSRYVLVQ